MNLKKLKLIDKEEFYNFNDTEISKKYKIDTREISKYRNDNKLERKYLTDLKYVRLGNKKIDILDFLGDKTNKEISIKYGVTVNTVIDFKSKFKKDLIIYESETSLNNFIDDLRDIDKIINDPNIKIKDKIAAQKLRQDIRKNQADYLINLKRIRGEEEEKEVTNIVPIINIGFLDNKEKIIDLD